MTYAAGVRRGLHAFRIVVSTPDAGYKIKVLALGEVRQLVKTDTVIFRALILVDVVLRRAVTEIYYRAVSEFSRVRGGVKGKESSRIERECRSYERFLKLREGAPKVSRTTNSPAP